MPWARRTLRGIDQQIVKAENAVAGRTPVKRNRYVRPTGAIKSVNRTLEARNRALAGIKGHITNLPNPNPEQVIGAYSMQASTTVVTGALTASVLAGAVIAVPVAGGWTTTAAGHSTRSAPSPPPSWCWPGRGCTPSRSCTPCSSVSGSPARWCCTNRRSPWSSPWFHPHQRASAVLAIIVVAGFASTVFMPLSGIIVDRRGWRTALLILAALHGAVTAARPGHPHPATSAAATKQQCRQDHPTSRPVAVRA